MKLNKMRALNVMLVFAVVLSTMFFAALINRQAYAANEIDYSQDVYHDNHGKWQLWENEEGIWYVGFDGDQMDFYTEDLDNYIKWLYVAEYTYGDQTFRKYFQYINMDDKFRVGDLLDQACAVTKQPVEEGTLTLKIYCTDSQEYTGFAGHRKAGEKYDWYLLSQASTKFYTLNINHTEGGNVTLFYYSLVTPYTGETQFSHYYFSQEEVDRMGSYKVEAMFVEPAPDYSFESLEFNVEPIDKNIGHTLVSFSIEESTDVYVSFKKMNSGYSTLKLDIGDSHQELAAECVNRIQGRGLTAFANKNIIYIKVPNHWDMKRIFTQLNFALFGRDYYSETMIVQPSYKHGVRSRWHNDESFYFVYYVKGVEVVNGASCVLLKPLQEFNDDSEVQSQLEGSNSWTDGQTIYLAWRKYLPNASITIESPICGTAVYRESNTKQTPQPVIKGAEGVSVYKNTSFWVTEENGYYTLFEGVVENGNSYKVAIDFYWVTFGYITNNNTIIKVNGVESQIIQASKANTEFSPVNKTYAVADVPMDHDWYLESETVGDCVTESTKSYNCKNCTVTKVESTLEDNHDWGEWESVNEFVHQRVCTRSINHVETAEHIWEINHFKTEASCVSEGEAVFKCTADGCTAEKEGMSIDPNGHDWNEWEVTKEATADEDGSKVRTCKHNSEHKETEAIPKNSGGSGSGSGIADAAAKKELGDAINDAKDKIKDGEKEKYTEDSVKNLEEAIKNAEEILNKDNATKDEVDKAKKDLDDAVTGLKEKDNGGNNGGDTIINYYNITNITEIEKHIPDEVTPTTPAPFAAVEALILKKMGEEDIKGSTYAPLKFQSKKQKKNAVTLKWSKVKGAKNYVVYGSPCGNNNKMVKIATLSASKKSYTVKKINGKKLKKGTYYKFTIVAQQDDKAVAIAKSIHVSTSGNKKKANYKGVNVAKKTLSNAKKLKKGKSLALKAKGTLKAGTKAKKHIKKILRYESSNKKIATVSASGKIKAKKKGTCYIYAYTQSGIAKKIKVTVKK